MILQKKSFRIIAAVFVVYAGLCATHLGEFWPFSIYQMFSSAGRPWSRAIVRAVEPGTPPAWQTVSIDALPGRSVPIETYGVMQNDLANYLQKTGSWGEEQVSGVEALFARYPKQEGDLVVYSVHGKRDGERGVHITARPVLLMGADTTWLNPALAAVNP